MALPQLRKWLVHFCDEIIITDLDKYGEGEGERHGGEERRREIYKVKDSREESEED